MNSRTFLQINQKPQNLTVENFHPLCSRQTAVAQVLRRIRSEPVSFLASQRIDRSPAQHVQRMTASALRARTPRTSASSATTPTRPPVWIDRCPVRRTTSLRIATPPRPLHRWWWRSQSPRAAWCCPRRRHRPVAQAAQQLLSAEPDGQRRQLTQEPRYMKAAPGSPGSQLPGEPGVRLESLDGRVVARRRPSAAPALASAHPGHRYESEHLDDPVHFASAAAQRHSSRQEPRGRAARGQEPRQVHRQAIIRRERPVSQVCLFLCLAKLLLVCDCLFSERVRGSLHYRCVMEVRFLPTF